MLLKTFRDSLKTRSKNSDGIFEKMVTGFYLETADQKNTQQISRLLY